VTSPLSHLTHLTTMGPLKVLLILDLLSEDAEVLPHVVGDHPLTVTREDLKEMRELSDVEFQRRMIVEEPEVINAPHQQSVVLSKAKVIEDAAVLYWCRLLESEPKDLDLIVLGWLNGHKVATLAIVEGLDLLDFFGLFPDLTFSHTDFLDRGPDGTINRVVCLILIQVDGLEIRGSFRVLFNGGIVQ
jgi:hypothetical protein